MGLVFPPSIDGREPVTGKQRGGGRGLYGIFAGQEGYRGLEGWRRTMSTSRRKAAQDLEKPVASKVFHLGNESKFLWFL